MGAWAGGAAGLRAAGFVGFAGDCGAGGVGCTGACAKAAVEEMIAAAIKTSRVARHLCHSKQLKPTSFLSDIYLSNIVELLWELCKDTEQGVS